MPFTCSVLFKKSQSRHPFEFPWPKVFLFFSWRSLRWTMLIEGSYSETFSSFWNTSWVWSCTSNSDCTFTLTECHQRLNWYLQQKHNTKNCAFLREPSGISSPFHTHTQFSRYQNLLPTSPKITMSLLKNNRSARVGSKHKCCPCPAPAPVLLLRVHRLNIICQRNTVLLGIPRFFDIWFLLGLAAQHFDSKFWF